MIDDDFIDTCMQAVNYDTKTGLIRTGIRRINSYALTTPSRVQVLKMITSVFPACRIEFHAAGLPFGMNKIKADIIRRVPPINAFIAEVE